MKTIKNRKKKVTNRVIMAMIGIMIATLVLVVITSVQAEKEIDKDVTEFLNESFYNDINEHIEELKSYMIYELNHYTNNNNFYEFVQSENKEELEIILQQFLIESHYINTMHQLDFIYVNKNNSNFGVALGNSDIKDELLNNDFFISNKNSMGTKWSFEKLNGDVYFLGLTQLKNNEKLEGNLLVASKLDSNCISHFTGTMFNDFYTKFIINDDLKIDSKNIISQYYFKNNKDVNIAILLVISEKNFTFSNFKRIYYSIGIVLLANIVVTFIVFFFIIKKMRLVAKRNKDRLTYIAMGNYHSRMELSGYEEIDNNNKCINKLIDEVENRINELQSSRSATIGMLTSSLEAKDPYTKGHSVRVAEYSCRIAKEMGLSKVFIEKLKQAALLHDIGKIGVHEDILNKPGKLTDEEYDKVKQHPYTAAQILSGYEAFKDLKEIVISHHERFDGKGYPFGLKGKDISIGGRIISVADTFDAVTSDRVYRKGMSKDKATEILLKESGEQFDPEVINAFMDIVDSIKIKE